MLKKEYPHKLMHYVGLLLIVLILFAQPATAEFQTEEDKTISTSEKLLQATVQIEPDPSVSGSGFYIAPNRIITNNHIANSAKTNRVKFYKHDKTWCYGTIGYREEGLDLAIIEADCSNSAVLTIADGAKVGQSVIASGSPLDFDFSLSKGIISALRVDLIQFDAKVNYGSSGGVLADLNGNVVGVVVKKAKLDEFMSFAVPYYRVKQFIDRSE